MISSVVIQNKHSGVEKMDVFNCNLVINMSELKRYFTDIRLTERWNPVYILNDNIINRFVDEHNEPSKNDLSDYLKQLVFVQLTGDEGNYVVMSATDYERTQLGLWEDNGGYGYQWSDTLDAAIEEVSCDLLGDELFDSLI